MSDPFKAAAVLFDLDGTLVDSAPDFAAVLDIMADRYGFTAPGPTALSKVVSAGARAMVAASMGGQPGESDFDRRLAEFLELYGQQIGQTQAILYPGMAELLTVLHDRQIPWGVVTNKPVRFSELLMRRLQPQSLLQHCATLICPDHVTHSKPHPEPLLLASQQLGLPAPRCVYIGDHPRDIEAGLAAGMYTIAAGWGYLPAHPPITDWRSHVIASAASDLPALLGLPSTERIFAEE